MRAGDIVWRTESQTDGTHCSLTLKTREPGMTREEMGLSAQAVRQVANPASLAFTLWAFCLPCTGHCRGKLGFCSILPTNSNANCTDVPGNNG